MCCASHDLSPDELGDEERGEAGELHHRDGDIAELEDEALGAGNAVRRAGQDGFAAEADVVMIGRYDDADESQDERVAQYLEILFLAEQRHAEKERLRIHEDAPVPAEHAGPIADDVGIDDGEDEGGDGDEESYPQYIFRDEGKDGAALGEDEQKERDDDCRLERDDSGCHERIPVFDCR